VACGQSSSGGYVDQQYPGSQPPYAWCRTVPAPAAYYPGHPQTMSAAAGYAGPLHSGYYAPPPAGYPAPAGHRYLVNEQRVMSAPGFVASQPFSAGPPTRNVLPVSSSHRCRVFFFFFLGQRTNSIPSLLSPPSLLFRSRP